MCTFFQFSGITGFLSVLGYGAYKYKYRGNMTTSMFLMQLRVASQGMVIGALSLGIIYSLATQYVFKKEEAPPVKEIAEKRY